MQREQKQQRGRFFFKLVTCRSVETGVKLLFSLQLYFLSLGLSLGMASPKWTSERRSKMKS